MGIDIEEVAVEIDIEKEVAVETDIEEEVVVEAFAEMEKTVKIETTGEVTGTTKEKERTEEVVGKKGEILEVVEIAGIGKRNAEGVDEPNPYRDPPFPGTDTNTRKLPILPEMLMRPLQIFTWIFDCWLLNSL